MKRMKSIISVFAALTFLVSGIYTSQIVGMQTAHAEEIDDIQQEVYENEIDLDKDASDFSEEDVIDESEQETVNASQSDFELAQVENVIWKEGTTATASWDEVKGANYYEVSVYVYVNDIQLGSIITGTSMTQLDVQQEINSIANEINPELAFVDVAISVRSMYIGDDYTIS